MSRNSEDQRRTDIDSGGGIAPALPTMNPRAYEEALVLQTQLAQMERAALKLYEPMPFQESFHKSRARYRLIRKGNRSGGSVAALVELARAAMRRDPYKKFRDDKELVFWLVGFGERHIGQVFYRMLFEPGLFKIIRDKRTQQWRAFHPWDEPEREDEAVPAPPLIPEQYIDDLVWGNKGLRQFDIARISTGATIHAFTSGSEHPPMGSAVHGILIDEDIQYPYWVTEMMARLPDFDGRLWWSAAHLLNNDAIINLSDMAAEERDLCETDPTHQPVCEEFNATIYDNRFMGDKQRSETIGAWRAMGGEDEVQKRVTGMANTTSSLMYPTFSLYQHGMSWEEYDRLNHCRGWTRYMVIDPGWDRTAVLFACVPPPEVGDFVLCEDNLYLRNHTVEQFADAVAAKVNGRVFHDFIIDDHGARPSNQTTGKPMRYHYSEAFRARGIKAAISGYGFRNGCDDPLTRQTALRQWMQVPEKEGSVPRFRVLLRTMEPLFSELARYRRNLDKKADQKTGSYLDVADPRSMQKSHLVSCVEYLAAYNPKYHAPRAHPGEDSPANRRFEELRRKRKKNQQNYVNLGPREKAIA